MGLDMYLRAEKYVSNYDHAKAEEKAAAQAVAAAVGITPFSGNSLTVSLAVGYWRKANHIHKWFVDHVQEGKDECVEHYASREKLKELVETCKAVLADRTKAAELLPTQSGFFFGGTEFDDYYFGDLESTIKQIEPLLTEERWKDFSFNYQSSW